MSTGHSRPGFRPELSWNRVAITIGQPCPALASSLPINVGFGYVLSGHRRDSEEQGSSRTCFF